MPVNQTLVSQPQNTGYQPTNPQNYMPVQQQKPAIQQSAQKIQTNALIPTKAPVEQQISTTQQTQPIPEPIKEDVILEEVIYIPSALQTTPVDEIEILSESTMPVEEFKKIEEVKIANNEIPQPQISVIEKVEEKTPLPVKQEVLTPQPQQKTVEQKLPEKSTVTKKQPTPIKETTPKPRKPKKVKVYKGDTLYSIAQKNNVKVYYSEIFINHKAV